MTKTVEESDKKYDFNLLAIAKTKQNIIKDIKQEPIHL